MIIKKDGDRWTEVPEALNSEKEYDALKGQVVASTKDGYVGEVELMYATHREIFDSLSPSSLREKNFQYVLLKQKSDELKKELELLKSEIVTLHSALDNKADTLDAGSAGTIQFQEVKKTVYSKDALEQIKKLGASNVLEEKISDKQLKAFVKDHPELKEKIDALKTYKTEIKMVVKANPEFIMPDRNAVDEMFREEREKACSERFRIYTNVHQLAEAYESKTIKLSEAEVFKSQIEILKNEFQKVRREELFKDALDHVKEREINEAEMN